MFFSSLMSLTSSAISTLNPIIILSSSCKVLQRYISFFEIGPIPALITDICFSLNKTIRASSDPSESAFATIPVC